MSINFVTGHYASDKDTKLIRTVPALNSLQFSGQENTTVTYSQRVGAPKPDLVLGRGEREGSLRRFLGGHNVCVSSGRMGHEKKMAQMSSRERMLFAHDWH